MKRKIIALSGGMNSGKDTVARMLHFFFETPRFLQHYWIYKYLWTECECGEGTRISFADPLKDFLSVLFSVPRAYFDNREKKETILVDPLNLRMVDKSTRRLSDNQFKKATSTENVDLINHSILTLRQAMQWYGTTVVPKVMGPNVWINSTLATPGNLLIGDVRFIKEANAIKKYNGKIILVERPSAQVTSNHISEVEGRTMKEQGIYDHIILNDGSMKDLFEKVKEYAGTLD